VRSEILTLKRARKLRRKMTLPEVLLWQQLRGKKLNGLQFRRQHPEEPYVLDFFCADARLAVEVDGISHETRVEHDSRRDAWLTERGIRVLRIPAADILKRDNMENVLALIAQTAAPPPPSAVPLPVRTGEDLLYAIPNSLFANASALL
jgi:very-short-patch-repair endonuclease